LPRFEIGFRSVHHGSPGEEPRVVGAERFELSTLSTPC
jgi:hypothetical protein